MPQSPFSGADTGTVWGRKEGRVIYQCAESGAVFFDRSKLGAETYDDYYPYLAGFDRARSAWELGIRRGRYVRQLAKMRRYLPPVVAAAGSASRASHPSLLDIGAGPGYFVAAANECGWNAAGVEVSAPAVAHGQERFGVRYTSLDATPDHSVDCISCHHVLEHLAEPRSFLDLLHRKLVAGGLLVVHVPHQQPLSSRLREWLFRNPGETRCSLYGDIHISGFTQASLRQAVERCGFQAHFTRTVGLWAVEYDPFFLRNYRDTGKWVEAAKKVARGIIDTIGVPFGDGDWVVGYFRAR
jgi:SAM-dependent methyltransferase